MHVHASVTQRKFSIFPIRLCMHAQQLFLVNGRSVSLPVDSSNCQKCIPLTLSLKKMVTFACTLPKLMIILDQQKKLNAWENFPVDFVKFLLYFSSHCRYWNVFYFNSDENNINISGTFLIQVGGKCLFISITIINATQTPLALGILHYVIFAS